MVKVTNRMIVSFVIILAIIGGAIWGITTLFNKNNKEADVVTTIFPIYDVCRTIMGDDSNVVYLEDNGVDLHSYQPTSADINTISKSKLFIYIGGESDDWATATLASANNAELQTLELLQVIVDQGRGIDESTADPNRYAINDEEEGEEGEIEYDEHIWLSIVNMIYITNAINDQLCAIYPDKAEEYTENTTAYVAELQTLNQAYETTIGNSSETETKNNTLVVADRFPFRYLVSDYNLNYYSVFSGCSAETEASFSQLGMIITKTNDLDVDYLLQLETSNGQIADTVIKNSNDTNRSKLIINSIQSTTTTQAQNTSYIQLMQSNLLTLQTALGYTPV